MKVFKKLLHSRSLFGSLTILILWYVLHLAIGSKIIPGPFETIVTFLNLMTGSLLLHILSSILRISVAIVLSMGIGIP
ncbi:MAG: ABC transporter permease, partial [Bacillota bacterium]|nr:ABC transporter permease [Bacillota bacterium]